MIDNSNCTSLANLLLSDYDTMQIIATFMFFLFGFVSVFGNSLMIISMYKSKMLLYGGYYTLIHYAITDIISGLLDLIYLPLAILMKSSFRLSFVMGFVLVFGEFSRKLFIVFMAMTKFYSIMFPLLARRSMYLAWYKNAIKIIWCLSVLSCLPFWIGRSIYFDACTFYWSFNERTLIMTSIYGLTFNISVTIIITVVYPACFVKVLRTSRTWNSPNSTCRRQSINLQNFHQERKIFCLFFLNSCTFVIYWLPIYLFELFHVHLAHYAILQEITRGIQISYNPLVYICINSNIRKAVKNIFQFKA